MSLRRRQVVYFPTSHPKYLLHTVIDSTLINISQSVQAIRNKWVTSVNVTYRSRAVMEALNCFVSSHLQMCCSTFSLSEIQLHAFGFQIAQSFQRSRRSHICMWNAMAFDTTRCPWASVALLLHKVPALVSTAAIYAPDISLDSLNRSYSAKMYYNIYLYDRYWFFIYIMCYIIIYIVI